jgi:glycerol-3-phosphate acyltransferase PlsY
MTSVIGSAAAVALAYLIGAIPFGFLIVKLVKGIDIRTVGSGNIGATNVGRTLGFRYFVLVFTLDLLKGFLPTIFFPRLLESLVTDVPDSLNVFVGLASILGHNFPVYLRFKGGKGVATGLGVILALDPFAGVAAAVGFLIVLGLTGFVSLGSVLGGTCFVLVHFKRVGDPFAPAELPMTIVTFALLVLITYRHRANFKRIAAGTEPKVKLGKRRAGRVRASLVLLIALVAAAMGLVFNATRKNQVTVGSIKVEEVARLATHHQRAERLLFLEDGQKLAITCPRYGRVVLTEIDDSLGLKVFNDLQVEGRPVAIAQHAGRLYVLQRPNGDQRHLEEAYWDVFDFQGKPAGPRVRVGWDPDDLAVHPDGRHLFVLTSGHAEGETNRPSPALLVFDLDQNHPVALARVEFSEKQDNPARLALTADGRLAAVSIQGSRQVAWVDLSDVEHPRLLRRDPLEHSATPEALWFDRQNRLWLADPEGLAIGRQETADGPIVFGGELGGTSDVVALPGTPSLVAVTLPRASSLELFDVGKKESVGRLRIRGTANLASTRPLGLASCSARGLLAVANRDGGSVYLFRVSEADRQAPHSALARSSGPGN